MWSSRKRFTSSNLRTLGKYLDAGVRHPELRSCGAGQGTAPSSPTESLTIRESCGRCASRCSYGHRRRSVSRSYSGLKSFASVFAVLDYCLERPCFAINPKSATSVNTPTKRLSRRRRFSRSAAFSSMTMTSSKKASMGSRRAASWHSRRHRSPWQASADARPCSALPRRTAKRELRVRRAASVVDARCPAAASRRLFARA